MKKMTLIALVCILMGNLSVIPVVAGEIKADTYVDEVIAELGIDESKVMKSENGSLNSIEVENGDGTNTIHIFNKDIKYIDENGDIRDKDLSIVASTDRKSIQDGYVATVKANDIKTSYPISFRNQGIMINNIQLEPIESVASLASSDINSVYYNNVFEGVNLICRPELQGFSGYMEMEELDAFNNIKFNIVGDNNFDITCEDGVILILVNQEEKYKLSGSAITNENGQVVGTSSFSLNNDNSISMEYNTANSVAESELYTTELDFEQIVVSHEEIQEVTVFSDSSVSFDDNYSYIGTYYESENTEGVIARTYTKFDLTALENIDYDRIISAYFLDVPYEYGTDDVEEVYFVNDEWDINEISWLYLPDTGKRIFRQSIAQSADVGLTYGDYRPYYITNAVQAWLQGMDNNGIMIKTQNDEGWCKKSFIPDMELKSHLVVTYSEYTDVPETKGVVSNELYYLINKNSKKALGISTNDNIVQKTFDMSDQEKWQLLYHSTENGVEYYLIKANDTNEYLKSNISSSHETCVGIGNIAETDSILWQIKRNWDGSYKLLPKNQNLEKALTVHGGSVNDNAYLCLENQTVDFEQEDDWTLIPVNRSKATLYGQAYEASYLISINEVNKVSASLNQCGYNSQVYIDSHASSLIGKLFDSNFWYFSSHGVLSRMHFYSKSSNGLDTEISAIGILDAIESDEYEEDEMARDISVYGIKDYEGNLNKLQLSFMNSCESAGNNAKESLIGTMYEEGAHCILGFARPSTYFMSQEWYGYFNLALNKLDVDSSLVFADRMLDNGGNLSNTNSTNVLGDTSIFYNYEEISVNEEVNTTTNAVNENTINEISVSTNLDETNTTDGEDPKDFAYVPDSDSYDVYTDENGNLYGEKKDSDKLSFYLMNRRNTNFNGDYVYMNSAIGCSINFITNLGYSYDDFDFELLSNEYSSEYIIEFNATNSVEDGDVEKIKVYVECDSSNAYYVTFLRAFIKEGN